MDSVKGQRFRRGDAAALVLLLALTAAAAWPLLASGERMSHDSDFLLYCLYHGIARRSVLEFGQFPFRTHFLGGGYPFAAEPETPAFSPFFLLTLWLGEVRGLKAIACLMYVALGCGGYWMMRRELRLQPLEAALGAGLLVTGGWMPQRIASSNYPELCYALAPFLAALWGWTVERGRRLLPVALALAALLMDGRQAWMCIMAFLAAYSVLRAMRFRRGAVEADVRWLVRLPALWLAVVGLGAAKLAPMLCMLHERGAAMPAGHASWYSPSTVGAMDWTFPLAFVRPGAKHVEPHVFIGAPAALLCLVGAAAAARRVWRMLALGLLSAWLALAWRAPLDLFHALWAVTPMRFIDYPLKYFDFFIFLAAAACAAHGLAAVRRRWPARPAAAAWIAAVCLAWPLQRSARWNAARFDRPPPPPEERGPFCQTLAIGMPQGRRPRPECSPYVYLLHNMGSLDWEAEITFPTRVQPKFFITPRSRLKPNSWYRGEAFGLRGATRVKLARLTPLRIELDAAAPAPDTIVVNQNFDPRWRCDIGKPFAHDGLLAVRLPGRGRFRVRFFYAPYDAYVGLGVSAATLIGLAPWPWRRGARRKSAPRAAALSRRGVVVLAACAAAAAVLWAAALWPSARVDALIWRAHAAESHARMAEARALYAQAAACRPRREAAWIGLARCEIALGRPERAIAALQECLKRRPRRAGAWFDLANAYWLAGRPARAVEAIRKSLELAPFRAEAYANLAVYLAGVGRAGEAKRMLDRAEELGYPGADAIRETSAWREVVGAARSP